MSAVEFVRSPGVGCYPVRDVQHQPVNGDQTVFSRFKLPDEIGREILVRPRSVLLLEFRFRGAVDRRLPDRVDHPRGDGRLLKPSREDFANGNCEPFRLRRVSGGGVFRTSDKTVLHFRRQGEGEIQTDGGLFATAVDFRAEGTGMVFSTLGKKWSRGTWGNSIFPRNAEELDTYCTGETDRGETNTTSVKKLQSTGRYSSFTHCVKELSLTVLSHTVTVGFLCHGPQ